jgi:regulator of sigma E protease
MAFFSSLFYFVIVIGILVFIHELGHFLAARLSGMHTDTFSFGMGPRLFGYNRIDGFSFGKLPEEWKGDGHCDYRFSAFPIGGYVKIAGMVDESMDTEWVDSEPKEWEFRSKNVWQKLFVLSAGVIMNILLAFFIYAGISFIEGKTILKTTTVGFVQDSSLAKQIGIQPGDKIISINNAKVDSWDQVLEKIALEDLGDTRTIVIKRGNETLTLQADGKQLLKAITGSIPLGLVPENTVIVIGNVLPNSNAEKAGLSNRDTIVSVNDEQINAFTELTGILKKHKNGTVKLVWKRDNKLISKQVKVDETGKIGFAPIITNKSEIVNESYGLFGSLAEGAKRTINFGAMFINSIKQIFNGNISAKESLGGPIMIAKGARDYAQLGAEAFLNFIAMLSITLAIINILPLPALDGGHIVFIIIEAIIGKELPLKFKIAVQNVGIFLLLALMAYVFYNDIMRLFN